jgi:hypothetical protein
MVVKKLHKHIIEWVRWRTAWGGGPLVKYVIEVDF